jgi:hypothetical protein
MILCLEAGHLQYINVMCVDSIQPLIYMMLEREKCRPYNLVHRQKNEPDKARNVCPTWDNSYCPYSLLPTPYSLLPTPYSLLPTPSPHTHTHRLSHTYTSSHSHTHTHTITHKHNLTHTHSDTHTLKLTSRPPPHPYVRDNSGIDYSRLGKSWWLLRNRHGFTLMLN